MKRATQLFTDDHRARVNTAIADAERQTAAEIVPVVASASDRYDRAEDIAGLWLAAVGAIAAYLLIPGADLGDGSWATPFTDWRLIGTVVALVVGFVLGAALATHAWTLRRLFTASAHMNDAVDRAARAAFFDSSIHHTRAATGVLIYVSLYEHRAAVLADRTVTEAIGDERITGWCDDLTARLAAGDALPDAIADLVREIGEHLAEPLPPAPDDTNELADQLVLVD